MTSNKSVIMSLFLRQLKGQGDAVLNLIDA